MARILVVEDESSLRDLYVQILEEAGFFVDSAPDGDIAYDLIHKGGYDLVLLDLVLPKLDGITIMQRLASNPPTVPNRHIVILSNLGKDDAIGTAMSLGASGYLIKSDYTPDQIVAQVRHFMV